MPRAGRVAHAALRPFAVQHAHSAASRIRHERFSAPDTRLLIGLVVLGGLR